ncbi:MAG: hypothetical protein KEFWMYNX_002509, partial [Candidatus Fervidibacter sp.]
MSKTVLVLGALGVVIVAVGAWLLGQPSAPEPP